MNGGARGPSGVLWLGYKRVSHVLIIMSIVTVMVMIWMMQKAESCFDALLHAVFVMIAGILLLYLVALILHAIGA